MLMNRTIAPSLAALSLAVAASALAAPLPPDPAAVWTLQDENASISTAGITDRYYTNGLRLGYASPTGVMPPALDNIAASLWGDGQRRYTIDITQQIYTPDATSLAVPPRGDRPYAGVLMGTVGLLSDTAAHRSIFTVGVGVMGPSPLAEQVQNGFHEIISQRGNRGWSSQLRDEPEVQVISSRTYRVKLWQGGGIETDMLPELTAGLGTLRTYVQTGVTLRIGQGLDADYGVARVRPGPSGGDVFQSGGVTGWYVFAGVDGKGVARDATLDGNLTGHSLHVHHEPFVGEGHAGFALIFSGVRLTYSHVLQSSEFKAQKGGLHQFGSLALSMRF